MSKPALEIIFKKPGQGALVLIVDKEGSIGEKVIELLQSSSQDLQTVFVSNKSSQIQDKGELFLPVAFGKKVPVIPDGEYSHIIVVYSGEAEVLEILSACLKKAEKQKCRLIVAINLRAQNREKAERIISSSHYAAAVYIGDIFSSNVFSTHTLLNRFLIKTKKTNKINVDNLGLSKIYPVFLDDVGNGIVELAFGTTATAKNFLLFPQSAQTQLSLARLIQKIDPNIKIDFLKNGKSEENLDAPAGKYLLPENYPVLDKIKKVYEEISQKNLESNHAGQQNVSLGVVNRGEGNKRAIPFILSFIFFLILLPVVILSIFSVFAIGQLTGAKNAIGQGDMKKARIMAGNAVFLFSAAKKTQPTVIFEAELIGQKEKVAAFFPMLDVGEKAASIVVSLSEISNQFLQGHDIVSSTHSLKQALVFYEQLQVEQKELDNFPLPTKMASAVIDLLPDIFGFEKKKEYLVLFQNNMELRPGGGFIGSYGLLVLENGKIVDFTVSDVYDADGQLKGHVEPPFPIRRFLPSIHWYLRDSNWSVDFGKSASASAYFLNVETGKSVDGVIAVDVSFVKSLLSVLGPVYVADYKETVSADNLYEVTQKHAEQDFFPGSTQKKDFLRSLFISLQQSIFSRKQIPYSGLGKAVEKAILEKHLLFAFSDSSLQSVFTVNNMSSSLWDARISSKTKLNDFLGISEANLGVNKANYFVSRSASQQVTINKDGLVNEKLTITYKNQSKDNLQSKEYKNYLRIIVPQGSKLTSLSIDGKVQSITAAITDPGIFEGKKFSPPIQTEIEETIEGDKTIFGLLLIVPPNTEKTIAISYALPTKYSLLTSFDYNLKLFKQPGVENYPYTLTLLFPQTYIVVNKPKPAESGQGSIIYNTILDKDIDLPITFSQKE